VAADASSRDEQADALQRLADPTIDNDIAGGDPHPVPPAPPPRGNGAMHANVDGDEQDFTDWPDGRIDGFFEAEPPPHAWFCHERLLAGRGHLLTALGGSSKTRMQYHLGIGAVLGHLPWAWRIAVTGSAALFLTEDVRDQVHRTMHSFGQKLSPDNRALLCERLRVFPLAGRRALLLELNGNALAATDVLGWMMRQVEAMPKPVTFIGIDPAIGVSEGDEMSQTHQRRLGELADHIAIRTGACVVLSSHAPKGTLSVDEPMSHSSRGGGAITDALRAEFVLRNMTADEARKFGITDPLERRRHLQLVGTKGNELPPDAFVPVWLRRSAIGMLEQVSLAQSAPNGIGAREQLALDILVGSSGADGSAVPTSIWRDRCVAQGLIAADNLDAQNKALQRLRDPLLAAGYVHQSERGRWIPR